MTKIIRLSVPEQEKVAALFNALAIVRRSILESRGETQGNWQRAGDVWILVIPDEKPELKIEKKGAPTEKLEEKEKK